MLPQAAQPSTSPPPGYPAGGASPYAAYPPQPEYTVPASGGNYPDYTPQQPQDQLYLPQNQTIYQAPPSYPGYQGYTQPGQMGPQSYATPPPPPPRRQRISPVILTFIIVLVLLLLAGSGLIYYVGVYQPKAQRDQAATATAAQLTTTANAQASTTAAALATTNAQASATANAQATVNAQASATATAFQGILTTATSGTHVFDALNAQSSNGWDILSNNSTYYLLRINTNGAYDLFLYKSSQSSSAQRLFSNTAQSFKTGTGQANIITLVARGNNLYFYINSQFVDSASDGTFTSGKIGVFGEDGTNPTDAAFANAQVWQL